MGMAKSHVIEEIKFKLDEHEAEHNASIYGGFKPEDKFTFHKNIHLAGQAHMLAKVLELLRKPPEGLFDRCDGSAYIVSLFPETKEKLNYASEFIKNHFKESERGK